MATQPDPMTEEERKIMDAMQCVRSKLVTVESKEAALSFRPSASDVFIATTPKSGTTWMSQICHQLRTGGDMDFNEITEVVPFLEAAADLGQNCYSDQRAEPRLFKTHLSESLCPKGGKYIVVIRNPYDVVVSQFKFLEGWYFETGSIQANHFVQQISLNGSTLPSSVPMTTMGGYSQKSSSLDYCMAWWVRRHEDNVLIVFYEDMREDLEKEVKRVAEFIGVRDAKAVEVAVHRSRFDYMFERRTQFDDSLLKSARNVHMGIDASAGMRHGKVASSGGKRHLLNATSIAMIDEAWARSCIPVTGAKDYEEWRAMWHAERRQKS